MNYCLHCHKLFRFEDGDNCNYCFECICEAYEAECAATVEVPENCTICTKTSCHRCPNEDTELASGELSPDWCQSFAPGEQQMLDDILPF